MTTIDHSNLQPWLDRLNSEPYFKIGSKSPYEPDAWYWQIVRLELPIGELAKDGLTTMAIVGRNEYTTEPLTGKEGFNAQGLEGKAVVRKQLFGALMNLRDLIPAHRGRIVLRGEGVSATKAQKEYVRSLKGYKRAYAQSCLLAYCQERPMPSAVRESEHTIQHNITLRALWTAPAEGEA